MHELRKNLKWSQKTLIKTPHSLSLTDLSFFMKTTDEQNPALYGLDWAGRVRLNRVEDPAAP